MTLLSILTVAADTAGAAADTPTGDAVPDDDGSHPLATAFYMVVAVGALIYLWVSRRKPKDDDALDAGGVERADKAEHTDDAAAGSADDTAAGTADDAAAGTADDAAAGGHDSPGEPEKRRKPGKPDAK